MVKKEEVLNWQVQGISEHRKERRTRAASYVGVDVLPQHKVNKEIQNKKQASCHSA